MKNRLIKIFCFALLLTASTSLYAKSWSISSYGGWFMVRCYDDSGTYTGGGIAGSFSGAVGLVGDCCGSVSVPIGGYIDYLTEDGLSDLETSSVYKFGLMSDDLNWAFVLIEEGDENDLPDASSNN